MRNDYAVFILSHGRSDRVYTVETLKQCGYTGKTFIVCDDDDGELKEYQDRFANVLVFHKGDYAKRFDIGDNGGDDRVVVYARNAMRDIAMSVGYRYYIVLDDDYKSFEFRYPDEAGKKLLVEKVRKLDEVFGAFFDFLDVSGAVTVCMAQGGDFIGGVKSGTYAQKLLRKAMNVWFCDTQKPFNFYGRINEDTTTYTLLGQKGKLFFTVCDVSVTQIQTQKNKGGLTDIYCEQGTYYKSFYSVMMSPSCVKVAVMGDKHLRMHHRISWDNCVPMILNERYKRVK